MVKIEVKYEAGFRCVATHIPSGRELITDAPTDNHGKGESFSPTDLLATSMLTCIMTIIGIRAERKESMFLECLAVWRKLCIKIQEESGC